MKKVRKGSYGRAEVKDTVILTIREKDLALYPQTDSTTLVEILLQPHNFEMCLTR